MEDTLKKESMDLPEPTEVEEDEEETTAVDLEAPEVPAPAPEAAPSKTLIAQGKDREVKYKYYCESCSNYAFFSNSKIVFEKEACHNCGATVSYKEENYLAA